MILILSTRGAKILFTSLSDDLDLAVVEVLYVSGDILVKRLSVDVLPESDSLNPPCCNGRKSLH